MILASVKYDKANTQLLTEMNASMRKQTFKIMITLRSHNLGFKIVCQKMGNKTNKMPKNMQEIVKTLNPKTPTFIISVRKVA